MEQYKIKNVIDRKTGKVKPERIGRIVCEPYIYNDLHCYMEYIKNADGSPRSGYLHTSHMISKCKHENGDITLTTKNSIYELYRIGGIN